MFTGICAPEETTRAAFSFRKNPIIAYLLHDTSSSHHRELRASAMNLWAKIVRAWPTKEAGVIVWPLCR
jgi:hypothetical protein